MNEGRSCAELLRQIRNNTKPENAGVDVKSIRRPQIGVILNELGSKIGKKSILCETVHNILGTKVQPKTHMLSRNKRFGLCHDHAIGGGRDRNGLPKCEQSQGRSFIC